MPRFKYTALDLDKKKVKGTLSSENLYAARKQLRSKGLRPVDISELGFVDQKKSFIKKSGKKQVVNFTKQLATLINSGIKLTDALSVLTAQVTDARFKAALTDIRDRVITGESFTDALSDYDDYFDVIYISMIRVGEMTGSFGPSLNKIAEFMNKRGKMESKLITAMIYPVILMSVGIIVMLILTTFVIPRIGEQMRNVGRELPQITQFVLGVSDVLKSPQWLLTIFVVLFILVVALRKFIKTQRGALMKDQFLLGIPLIGKLIKQAVAVRFTSTLSTLLASGMPIAESLKVVSEVTGNMVMANAIKGARDRILSGADISTPLSESGILDATTAHMVAVGEQSGELETMLNNISEALEEDNEIMIERLSALVEPLIIIFIAAGVGVLAAAMILPMVDFSTSAM